MGRAAQPLADARHGDNTPHICVRCIMSRAVDPHIHFDEEGVCNHCRRYDALIATRVFPGAAGQARLEKLAAKIKKSGRGRSYDCLIGVSGGVDSTYVAYLVKSLGLRPLAVHFDNGWNSELAVENIEKVLKKLDIDLYTYVVDWPEFKDLQIAFLKSSTADGEIPTDHAIFALLWHEAARRNIKYIISGMNFRTEAIFVPHWSYGHSDWRYIKDVHRRFGTRKLKTYPHFGFAYLAYINLVKRIRSVSILNYGDYHKETARQVLEKELGWRAYGGKHHESIYTRFYQGVFLPQKFGIDKRYGHNSDLINSGQLSREAALAEVAQPSYEPKLQIADREYVCKKLGLSLAELQEMIDASPKSFRDYRNSYGFVQKLRRVVNWLRAHGIYPK